MSSANDTTPSRDWPREATPPDHGIRVLVPYTSPGVTREALAAARAMTRGLAASIAVVAVHVIPYPAPFHVSDLVRRHLEKRLEWAAGDGPDRAEATIVLARSVEEGFRAAECGGTIVVGSRKRWWPTRERRLARTLERCGCRVVLVRLEGRDG